MKNDKLKLISSKKFKYYEDMYKIIDFLNKNLNNYGIVLGICEEKNKNVINIYEENR